MRLSKSIGPMFSLTKQSVRHNSIIGLITAALVAAVVSFVLFIKTPRKIRPPISPMASNSPIKIPKQLSPLSLNPLTKFQSFFGKVLGEVEKRTKDRKLKYEVFAFLPFWTIEKRIYIRYELLTTIAYFGVDFDARGNFIETREDGRSDGGWDVWQSDELADVLNKSRGAGVNFLLTIKGFDDTTIEELLTCTECRSRLIKNAMREVASKKADGVNLDFEYVSEPSDNIVFRFTQLVSDFSEAFHTELPGSEVTVSTYAKSASERKIHDIRNLAKVADSIFVMGYDFFRPASRFAGPVAPLSGAEKYGYDLRSTVDDYLKLSPPKKIILGVPYYGYDWPVEDEAPNSRTLTPSDDSGYPNMSSYAKSEYDVRNDSSARRWDGVAEVPYYSWFDEEHQVWRQCYYDDSRSLSLKYDLIKEKGLRGVGIWALGYDDKYPELWDLLEEKFTKL